MNSKRLQAIVSMVSDNDIVLDVGTDHGYIPIMLKKNNLCKEVYASDISKNALSFAINNFKKNNLNIETFKSDGFNDVFVSFNTAIIAGMGTSTILDILSTKVLPDKLIIASNNDYYLLRKSLNNLGYKIIEEKVIYENSHYYVILKLVKGFQKLHNKEYLFGLSNNLEYFKYLYNVNKKLLKKVPFKKKLSLIKENIMLIGLMKRK